MATRTDPISLADFQQAAVFNSQKNIFLCWLTIWELYAILRIRQRRRNYYKRGIQCTTTKLSSARIAARNSSLLLVSRNFSRRRVSPMSRSAAKAAAILASRTPEETLALVKCSAQFVLLAVKPARFLSSRAMTVRSTAATASANDNWNNYYKKTHQQWCAFLFSLFVFLDA